jgi:hypothetical protein
MVVEEDATAVTKFGFCALHNLGGFYIFFNGKPSKRGVQDLIGT